MDDFRGTGRASLLAGVSLATILAAGGSTPAHAQDPAIQLDLIGGWNVLSGGATQYGYTAQSSGGTGATPLLKPRGGFDGEVDLAVTPAQSPWTFVASARYGRSNTYHNSFDQSFTGSLFSGSYSGRGAQHETHLMVDFEVGRDIGLGLLGPHVHSMLAVGVRVARFTSTTVADLFTASKYHASHVRRMINRTSTGAGPMVSWISKVPLAGPFSLDLGVSGALLVMDEKASYQDSLSNTDFGSRSGTFLSPNPEAKAALSFHPLGGPLSVSAGYRIDAYFGALDGGWSDRHRVDRTFAGPFIDVGVKFR